MTEWIDFSVYAAMIAAYWFVFAGWASPLALQIGRARSQRGVDVCKIVSG